jgi:hypothetical protein
MCVFALRVVLGLEVSNDLLSEELWFCFECCQFLFGPHAALLAHVEVAVCNSPGSLFGVCGCWKGDSGLILEVPVHFLSCSSD